LALAEAATAAAAARTGVLLVNSGTPEAAEPRAVRAFLARFLADRRVVDLPRALWLPILHGLILPTRPRPLAAKYRRIWGATGSPLRELSRQLTAALAEELTQRRACVAVELGMLYSPPELADALARLRARGITRLVLLPLFPQYCGATTGAVRDHVTAELAGLEYAPQLDFIANYHTEPAYIEALRAAVDGHWRRRGRTALLLVSFHGIPERAVRNGDPYYQQCQQSAALLAQALGLGAGEWAVSFQSRFGPAGWLKPYTLETLRGLPARGVQEVTLVCPGFAVDCLETLEEIDIENRAAFMHAGGLRYEYVPALNDGAAHVACLAGVIARRAPLLAAAG
jgi:protoporphyrin/coproporphyrin ferrochelatase